MLKAKPKKWLKRALLRSSILDLSNRLAPQSALILSYHSIVEEPERTAQVLGISQARADFEAHMEIVARHFSPVTVEDVAAFAQRRRELPRRAVAVTFDDGFADNHDVALPILNRYGIPASFYIMVNAVEKGMLPWYCRIRFAFNTTRRPQWTNPEKTRTYELQFPDQRNAARAAAWDWGAMLTGNAQEEFVREVEEALEIKPVSGRSTFMMSWEQVRSLKKAGHTIGAHTLSHPNVAQVSEDSARSEIVGSKKKVEEQIGEPVEHFSYPHPALNPQWSKETLKITREAGFKSAVLTACGPVRPGDEPLALKRIYAANDPDQFTWNLWATLLGRSI